MKCESIRTQLTAYLDGELEGERGSAVRGHLRGCDACRQAASDEAALRDGLRALPPLDPPPSLWAGVQRQLAAAEVKDAERPGWRRVLARWALRAPQIGFGGAVIAAAIILLVVRTQRDDDRGPLRSADIKPVTIKPSHTEAAPQPPAPTSADDDTDVTAALAAEPGRVTESYAQTVRELLAVANETRAQWSDDRTREFDTHVASLQKKAAFSTDERLRRDAYRKLIRYLQRTAIHDDVALASTGGTR